MAASRVKQVIKKPLRQATEEARRRRPPPPFAEPLQNLTAWDVVQAIADAHKATAAGLRAIAAELAAQRQVVAELVAHVRDESIRAVASALEDTKK